MNLIEFLQDISIKGWQVWSEDERLFYDAPQEESTALILAKLKQQKTEIIQLLQQYPGILNVYPLSYGQRALWFLWQLEPLSHAYNASFAARICSEVDIRAMQKAFAALIERHPILRTNYPKLGSQPIQRVHDFQELDLKQIDASTWSEDELKAKVLEDHQQHFDLERGPVMRVRWFTRSKKEHIMLLSTHHIACDVWSIDILIEELSKLYCAQLVGVDASLPLVKHSYQDYVNWQRKILCGTQGEKLWSYWEHKLNGDLPALNLVTDKQRPPIQTYNGASIKFKLSSKLTSQLKELARRERVTFYMMLLAAFEVLLYRYTGQEDILVGSPTSGRSQSEFAPIVGYFVDPVVMRADLSNNPSFKDFLGQVRQTVLEALNHQDYPFALLVEKLQPHRDPSRSPIFQASFALQQLQKSQDIQQLFVDQIEKDIDWGGLKLRHEEIPLFEGQFDLTLEMTEGSSEVAGTFKYNTDLFDAETIERMVGHFQNLLDSIVENPLQKVGKLTLLSESERHQLLVEWNDTETDYPAYKCIHQLFEEQVEKTPDAIAVVFEEEQLTYEQLNQRANQLAHHLQTLGVKPEVLVGICVERSVEMVVGLLGILKAGGAYVPLDPNYPQERLSYMLEDSGVGVLVTQSSLLEFVPEHNALKVCLDSDWGVIEQHSQENLDVGVGVDNLAYVIYTSGSTGQAKGVLVYHYALVNHCLNIQSIYQLIPSDRVLQFSSLSFDPSLEQILVPLTIGAGVVVRGEQLWDVTQFKENIEEYSITIVNLPPAYWQQLVRQWVNCPQLPPKDNPRLIIIGGDAMPPETVKLWQKTSLASARLLNAYGPTEATITSTVFEVNYAASFKKLPKNIPIGRPIANTQIYILDSHLQPVPVGVPGELHIGGDGLARGYLNRLQLTSEKFIPYPFSNSKSERLYKTGDLARYLSDGNIEFLGRIDNQVKIRGFRIELGEIEAVLATHPQVNQAVVIAIEENTGSKRLVAYVVTNSEITTQKLREYLKEQLPDYMVPSAFVTLESLPLTPNGKVDRKALPAVDIVERDTEYVAPRTQSEQIIANIFAQVLNVENIGIEDNFFDLGGHSLLATQLISRVQESFSIEIPLRALFESSTVAQLDQTLTQLRNSNKGLTLPPIQPRTETEQLPLSWAQERLWFLNQLEVKSATYNIPAAVRVSGNLDINCLQKALSEIVQRHEVLRTSFQTEEGTPIQVINPEATININLVDLQQHLEQERQTLVKQLAQQEATTPFNLEIAPLIRCSLLYLSSEEYVLLLTMHHIVSDGWSIGVFIQEISSLYQAFTQEKPSPLAELPIQYADFTVWQRQYLSGTVLETQLNYWKQQLDSVPDLLQLPTDRRRPSVQTYQGSSTSFTINTDLTQKLQTLSRESGTTLFMTLLTAFATLLYRYSGQSDILIGSPIANRNRSEIESLIGFFVNTLVLRTRFEDDLTFDQLLAQVRETTLKAYEHQNVPFEQVVEALQPQRDLSYSPLFQVMFVLQNAPISDVELPGVTLSQIEIESTISKFDLTVSMTETEQGLVGEWEYNTDLFKGKTIERMIAHFQNVLEAIVENPQGLVSTLNLLSESERHQLLVEWNDTAIEYPKDKCIHQLFEEQVEKTPDGIAVVFEQEQLTYQQLNQRANQLAHHLQILGVKPEVLVGICVKRSVEMLVGLLGILKAGGAYVPLDPNYPQERLSYMLEDSDVGVLVTHSSLLEALPQHNAQVVCLDSDWDEIEQQSQENIDFGVSSDNLTYVIYTSGSTGTPKGVQIRHRGVVNILNSMSDCPRLTQEDTFYAITTISFDIAALELYLPLTLGVKIIIASGEIASNGDLLLAELFKWKITALQGTPATWQMLLTNGWSRNYPLKVLCGGEALSTQLAKQILETGSELWNLYGPTEATIWSTIYRVESNTTAGRLKDGVCAIGRPIANTQIYILDSHLQPVPIGVVGELYIGGDGLSVGYLNHPQLTSEKFIPYPFSNSKSQRLYKTGDLARYLADGNIEFLGRIDSQVKIRGFRIELGEIEAVLTTHPQVNQAVVIATEENTGNKRLVAYLVTNLEITTQELRHYVKAQLPDYMVPSAFVTLESLPLTPNGKVDRKALPAPDGEISRENEYTAPRTQSEQIIANIFAQTLNVENIGINDNFFELGGHSLLATQLISRVREAFCVEITLRELFSSPTVAQLDQTITQLRNTDGGLILPPIQPRGETEQLPLSWAQERLWFLNQLEGKSAIYNMPAALRVSGNLDLNALQKAISEIVQRHEVLRTSFQNVNGTPIQVIHPDATININLVDLQQLETTQLQNLVIEQAQEEATTPFDLENCPLIRCSLLQLSPSEYVLLLTMHHIISDGWSIGVFIQELSSLYQAFIQGKESPLAQLPIQYADFAVWQRQYISGQVLETQLDYWKQQLSGAPDLLQLSTDFPRPAVQTYQGRTINFSLNTDLTTKLQTLSRESGTTLFMTLYAAFSTLLYRYSGQSDIVVGSPIANRNRSEIEGLIGFFVNTLVLRTQFENNPSFKELLTQVRETTLKAYSNQDVPFEQIVEALQPQRSLSHHSPLFQVMFVLQNAPMSDVELPGVTLSPIQLESTIAKFDLTLSMTETEQGLLGEWEYNIDLFKEQTIERMVAHFQNLLEAIVENPSEKVGNFNLLCESERHQLLVEWNDTATEYPAYKCIHQLFEEQVEKTPDAIAVVFEEKQLTYQQLNQQANQLAHHLQILGVGPEVLVGICVERSIEMVVGLLGILKAGGAYVPFDPNYPLERLSYMLADSNVGVLVTQNSLLESLPEHNAGVVCLDTDWGLIEQQSQEDLEAVTSDNLAYVIYTSGSTGKPKGVTIEHHSVCNLAQAQTNVFDVTVNSNILQFASFSFDASVWEVLMAFTRGATLILGTASQLIPGDNLKQILHKHSVTHVTLPPSALAVLPTEELPQLANIIVAGEACPLELANKWSVGRHFFNAYGPTESTVCATATQIKSGIEKASIGRPIANTQIYILDKHLQPVPVGVPGELYIGGDGLARGYLNRPQLTSEKFIQSPFDNSKRLYKTGDLARYLGDGNIEFLGRIDNQVKVRGFRIELGEIEAVLTTHPQVNQSVVIALEENTSNKRLVAYVVSGQNNQSDATNALQSLQIEQWQKVYADNYSQSIETEGPSYNTVGWKSSYTGDKIPQQQMRQWVDSTVEQILKWQPKHVLEIGCGTGMLLFQIAPHCLSYCGTDFSTPALDYVEQQIKQLGDSYSHVSLSQKLAHDFTDIEEGRFDTVILNSVVQYFPSIDYLVEVLQSAVNTLTKGGIIFVGDVRSLPLLETFHTAINFSRATDSLTTGELIKQVKTAVEREEELILDSAFFVALKQHLPQIKHVQIQLKPGNYQNELTKFRYDVIIHVERKISTIKPQWLEYDQENLNLLALKQLLVDNKPSVVGIKDIPNARLVEEVTLVKQLYNSQPQETIGNLRQTLRLHKQVGIEPENFWSWQNELPYEVYISWSSSGNNSCYNAIFVRNELGSNSQKIFPQMKEMLEVKPWSAYANNPLKGEWNRHLVLELPEYLKAKLPEYMVPSAFVILDTLPLTPNGKIDRKALPAPDRGITLKHKYVVPRTAIELQLTQIWSEILNITDVGVQDNFFELGGHSLLAVGLMAMIQQNFQINLPLATLFQSPTIEQLAIVLGSDSPKKFWSPLVPIQPNGSLPPLFCVAGAGGNVLYFHHLARYLGGDQPFYGLQAQGLDGVTQPHQSVEEIATQYIQAIQTVQPVGPYFLAGHSFGGKVAFEMATQLQSMGESVAYVGILDTPAPIKSVNNRGDFSNWDNARWISQMAEAIEELVAKNLVSDYQTLASLTAQQQLNYFKEQLEMVGFLAPQTDIKVVRGLVKVFQTQCQMKYEPQNTYSAPIILFYARESEQQNFSHLSQDPTWGWNQFSHKEVEIHIVPGNHMSMMSEPHVKVLAKKLQQSLGQAQTLQKKSNAQTT